MKLRIDYERCSGHGRCYSVAPELFYDDELGYGQVREQEIDESQRADAERAVATCPEQAISLEP
jgi:ferredoxin